MPTATYHHLGDSPVTTNSGLTVDVCLRVTFAGVPEGLDGSPINDEGLWFEGMYRAQGGDPILLSPGQDGVNPSVAEARAHPGACQAIRRIAAGRGFEIDNSDITYTPEI